MEQFGSSNVRYTDSTRSPNFDFTQEASDFTEIAVDTNYVSLNRSFKRSADQYLPIPDVIKIMRQVLPQHVKISDDSKEIIQECVSEFITFITRQANKKCHQECRKIIKPEDILSAMGSTGFNTYMEPLTIFLKRYRNGSQVTSSSVRPRPAPNYNVAESMNFIQHQSQPAVVRPEPRVIRQTTSLPSSSTLDQPNTDELSQILEFLIANQGAQGSGSASSSSFFEPSNMQLN